MKPYSPEERAQLVRQYADAIYHPVHRYEATVRKMEAERDAEKERVKELEIQRQAATWGEWYRMKNRAQAAEAQLARCQVALLSVLPLAKEFNDEHYSYTRSEIIEAERALAGEAAEEP